MVILRYLFSLEQIILLPLFHPNPYFTLNPTSPLTLLHPDLTSLYPILVLFLDDGRYAAGYCLAAWYDDCARSDKWNNVESHAERDDAPG